MAPDMVEKLGYMAEKQLGKYILQGNYVSDVSLDTYTNKFLKLVSKSPALRQFSSDVDRTDFVKYWKGDRERTSSSISGRHFGHYKAASSSHSLSEIHASFQHVASKSGLCLSRWKKGLTVMLEKIEGNTKVNKLRAILLMEADFNQLNKLFFGNRMIRQSEANNRMPEELYGSRVNLNAILVAINRRLVIDICNQKRRNGAITGVNAAQCYDCIVYTLFILLCQKEGAPVSTLIMMFGVIQSMTYFICTTFGDSEGSYGGQQDIPFQGSYQGNGASPAIWLLISVYLALIMKDEGHVSEFKSPMTGIVLTLIGFLFCR